jgi:hypothetical protein
MFLNSLLQQTSKTLRRSNSVNLFGGFFSVMDRLSPSALRCHLSSVRNCKPIAEHAAVLLTPPWTAIATSEIIFVRSGIRVIPPFPGETNVPFFFAGL